MMARKAQKKANPAGVPRRAVRPAVKAPAPKSGTKTLLLSLALVGALFAGAYVLTGLRREDSSAVPTAMATPTAVLAAAAPTGAPTTPAAVYLRVETLQLDSRYGIWRRMPGVPVFLSPYREGDSAPDFGREGTIRQVTEEKVTRDGFVVAVTTFEIPAGTYWVGVDETALPAGCAVWAPALGSDAEDGTALSRYKIVGLTAHGGLNTAVVKFQIVCGVAPSPTTSVPTGTPPTEPPRETPPLPTAPVPTPTVPAITPVPPTPTEDCGPDCPPPWTPAPTPTEYPPWVPTPTSVR